MRSLKLNFKNIPPTEPTSHRGQWCSVLPNHIHTYIPAHITLLILVFASQRSTQTPQNQCMLGVYRHMALKCQSAKLNQNPVCWAASSRCVLPGPDILQQSSSSIIAVVFTYRIRRFVVWRSHILHLTLLCLRLGFLFVFWIIILYAYCGRYQHRSNAAPSVVNSKQLLLSNRQYTASICLCFSYNEISKYCSCIYLYRWMRIKN